jgi:hypothetical protein
LSFSKNCDRLLEGEIATKFLVAVLSQPRVKRLLSSEHFSVDGTLIEAWASIESFKPKDDHDGGPKDGGRNAAAYFRGETRSNATHRSTTDPDARLYRKGARISSQPLAKLVCCLLRIVVPHGAAKQAWPDGAQLPPEDGGDVETTIEARSKLTKLPSCRPILFPGGASLRLEERRRSRMVKTLLVAAGTLSLAAGLSAQAQVGGSGTTGFVPVWVGSTSLGHSDISSAGRLTGIGTTKPGAKLEVATGSATPALLAFGGAAPGGSDQNGSDGIRGKGGAADPDSGFAHGGSAVVGIGGASSQLFSSAGAGGFFVGDSDSGTDSSGDGIVATCNSNSLAGKFEGDVDDTGTLSAAVKHFRIDDRAARLVRDRERRFSATS